MTDKSAAAVRELAEKWGYTLEGWIDPLTGHPGRVLQPAPDKCLADLTALISENYTANEDIEKIVEERLVEFGNMIRDEPNGDIPALADYFMRTINLKTREK